MYKYAPRALVRYSKEGNSRERLSRPARVAIFVCPIWHGERKIHFQRLAGRFSSLLPPSPSSPRAKSGTQRDRAHTAPGQNSVSRLSLSLFIQFYLSLASCRPSLPPFLARRERIGEQEHPSHSLFSWLPLALGENFLATQLRSQRPRRRRPSSSLPPSSPSPRVPAYYGECHPRPTALVPTMFLLSLGSRIATNCRIR